MPMPQQGYRVQPVTCREEALAVQTDFLGPGTILPCLGSGTIYLKRFNPNTGASDLMEFAYVQPQPVQVPVEYAPMSALQQLTQRVEQIEKGVTQSDDAG